MRDFFAYASTLVLRRDYSSLWRLADRLGIDEVARVGGDVTLEDIFTILEVLTVRLWDPLPENEAMAALSKADMDTIGGFDFWGVTPRELMVSFITEVLTQATTALKEGSCHLHDRFVKGLSKGDAVISLNYDLLVDQSLSKSRVWNPFDGYGTDEFEKGGYWSQGRAPGAGYEDAEILVPRSPDRASDVLLLKLHGSLNWWWWAVEQDLGDPVIQRTALEICGLLSLRHAFKADLDPGGGAFVGDVWPKMNSDEREAWLTLPGRYRGRGFGRFIIPPSGFKSTPGQVAPWLRDVWSAAFRVLARADEIVLIGYSVPSTDIAIRLLLSDARSRSPKRAKLTIVNPHDPSSVRHNLQRGGTPYNVDSELVTEIRATFAEYVDQRMRE